MQPTRIMSTLAAVATLGSFAIAPALAVSGTLARATATTSSVSSGPFLGAEAKRIKQEEQGEREHRETSYRAWFYRKYGYYPSAAQFRDWHYRSYGVYPS